MREERGKLAGDITISDDVTLWGTIAGTVTVKDGGKLYMRGAIFGNLVVQDGGRVHVFGNISGDLRVEEGSKVIHSGIIGRHVINAGGRLHIERVAKVAGKIKENAGETTYEGRGDWKRERRGSR